MWAIGINPRRIIIIGVIGLLMAATGCSVGPEIAESPVIGTTSPGPGDTTSPVQNSVGQDTAPRSESTPLPGATPHFTDPQTDAVTREPSSQVDGDPDGTRFIGCSGTGPVDFAVSPMRYEDILLLLPYGTLAGAHVTPIDHMYFEPADRSLGRDVYEVRVIQDGVIYSLEPRDVNVDTGETRLREWRMEIAHTCTFTSYFDLLTSLSPDIEAEWQRTRGDGTSPWRGIPVKAGQVIGRIGAQTLDFGVYDYQTVLPGFIEPAHYNSESWKVHTVDPFPYFPEDVRTALLDKMLRLAEPRAGKIDHDIEGTLSGNWFQLGTNGYEGTNRFNYWDGHLAIVPDALDPTAWRFSTGNFSGEEGDARQFGIKGDAPDPRTVTPETGLVTYELVDWYYYDRNDDSVPGRDPESLLPGADIASRNGEFTHGVVLLQLGADGTLKSEVFPDKTPADVTEFTGAAKTYER
jgi:hypothetical protein